MTFNKKYLNIFLAILSAFFVFFIFENATFAVPPKRNLVPSDYHTGMTWEEAQKSDKPMIVNFYVDWCSACKRFAPILESVRKDYDSKYNFIIIKADDPKNEAIAKQFNIMHYPTVYLIDKKKDKKVALESRNIFYPKKFKEELDKYLENSNIPVQK